MKNLDIRGLLNLQINPVDLYFDASKTTQFLLWLLAILLVKANLLLAPPVWDTATGVFPPAIYLFENGFALSSLSEQPGWWEGGPNVHTFSTWTWLIACVMLVFGGPTETFFVLHLITFMLAAWALVRFVQVLLLHGIETRLCIAAGVLVFLLPVVLVQIGYMYTELPVMAFGVLAWSCISEDRLGRAIFFSLLALSIKLTGIVICVLMAAILARKLIAKIEVRHLVLGSILLIGSISILYLPHFYESYLPSEDHSWGEMPYLTQQLVNRLISFPDVLLIILGGLIAGILCFKKLLQNKQGNDVDRHVGASDYLHDSVLILVFFPVLFLLGIVIMNFQGHLFLPRYVVPIIPFSIAQIVLFHKLIKNQNFAFKLIVGLCIFSTINHNGIFYPDSKAFSRVESSHAYQRYVLAQNKVIKSFSLLQAEVPIFVSREIDYMSSHEMYGNPVDKSLDIRGIYTTEYKNLSLQQFPEDFYLILSNPFHGGAKISALIADARASEEWDVENIYSDRVADFKVYIRRLRRTIHTSDQLQTQDNKDQTN